jgi:hypothetical protein
MMKRDECFRFNGLARAAGYPHQHDFASLADFEARIAPVLRQDGPVFATLNVEKGELSPKLDYRKLDDRAGGRRSSPRCTALERAALLRRARWRRALLRRDRAGGLRH